MVARWPAREAAVGGSIYLSRVSQLSVPHPKGTEAGVRTNTIQKDKEYEQRR